MLVTLLVLAFTLCATVTDVWRQKIYNWNTYTGILLALLVNLLWSLFAGPSAAGSRWDWLIGAVGFGDSLLGFLACGFILLVCFVFFRIGGGDVKLLAMLGAFLGLEQGIESLLWTFVIGGAAGLVVLIWRVGLWTLLVRSFRQLMASLRLGWWFPLSEEDRKELQPMLFLAPSALVAVAVVRFSLVEQLADVWTR